MEQAISAWRATIDGTLLRSKVEGNWARQIVYLDDHSLFRDGLKRNVLNGLSVATAVNEFDNGDTCLQWIQQCRSELEEVDLLITDINHMGLDGLTLIRNLREWELREGLQLMPVIIVSMITADAASSNYDFLQTVDCWFGKCAGGDIIRKSVDHLLSNHTCRVQERVYDFQIRKVYEFNFDKHFRPLRTGQAIFLCTNPSITVPGDMMAVILKDQCVAFFFKEQNPTIFELVCKHGGELCVELESLNVSGYNELRLGVRVRVPGFSHTSV